MGGMEDFLIQDIRKTQMELSKYYQIDDIYRIEEDSIEIYGKDIYQVYFCIVMKNEYGRVHIQHHQDRNELIIYNRRLKRQMNKIGSDMDFFGKYPKYMDLQTYLLVHTIIMNALGKHSSKK